MFKLSFTIALIVLALAGLAQSPHGEGFKTECVICHTSQNWKVTKANMSFDHNTTPFRLIGQHQSVDCKSCHKSLKFQEAKSECKDCHTDMHRNTLGSDCARCHDTKSWIIQNTSTMHQLSRFPLLGNHAVIDCASCHKSSSNLQFEPLGVECYDCHKAEYLATNAPNHLKSGYSTNCNECHGVKSRGWNASSFEHGFFSLTGGHSISCAECHTRGSFQKIANECVSCHQQNYNSTSKPNHQQTGFSTSCADCHTTNPGWSPANYKQHDASFFPIYSGNHKGEWNSCTDCHTTNSFSSFSCTDCHEHSQSKMNDEHGGTNGYSYQSISCYSCHPQGDKSGAFNHNTTNFPLTGAHAKTDCLQCHTNGFAGTSMECSVCHQKNFTNAQTPNHTQTGISADCKSCHSSTAWQPSSFKHNTTGYDLTGGHAAVVQCSDCHLGNTTSAKPECVSCHQAQYDSAKGHVASKFPTDCLTCHNANNWLDAKYDHSQGGFPLTDAHAKVECASCHTAGYIGTSKECSSCHLANYNQTINPNHKTLALSLTCTDCHTKINWQPSSFNHLSTGYGLTGAHAALTQCSSCHQTAATSVSQVCTTCHQAQYNGAQGHVASKFSADCLICHNANNWLDAKYDHSQGGFPLTDAHAKVECASCHTAGYISTSKECSSCHLANYNQTTNPNHKTIALSLTCTDCHTKINWQPSSFNHLSTGYGLTGAHAALTQCSSCHQTAATSASQVCTTCHQAQYNGAQGHVASKFSADCLICHNANNWLDAKYDHSQGGFPLTDAHAKVECASCHTAGYIGTSKECSSCHLTNYNQTTNPNHKTIALSLTCTDCHTKINWQPSSFNHLSTGYGLIGAHAALTQCSSCHQTAATNASQVCTTCHQAQYNGAPGHLSAKFPTDCRICHNDNNWLDAKYDHSLKGFPLTGAHTTADCASCHSSGYVGISTACSSCHTTNYNQTTNPNHKTLGLSLTCTDCHSTNPGWQPATFAIHNNYYPLTGAHATIAKDCAACHKGVYDNTPKTCYTCHTTDYNNTTNPAHKAAQYSTDCTSCHTTNAWVPSTFNHTSYFPISNGRHKLSCTTCHTTPTNYTIFTCITASCHGNAHNRSQGSTGCYRCHPTGKGD